MGSVDLLHAAVDFKAVGFLETAAIAQDRLNSTHALLVRNFPRDPRLYIDFLSHLGVPLENYSKRSSLPGNNLHSSINRIAYTPGTENKPGLHHGSNELRLHSARSWRHPRPRFLSMYFADAGWIDNPSGSNGESRLLRWASALKHYQSKFPRQFDVDFRILSEVRVRFEADNVREELSDLPIIYKLNEADDFDVGMRIKYNLIEKLRDGSPPVSDAHLDAVKRLWEVIQDPAIEISFQAHTGDIILVDNNRYGHGRHPFVDRRTNSVGATEYNPRELWSVTVE
ncbi:TauD/TfdA family dioxygenase [Bradyrhizobium sp. SZCCHNS1054]|uniref:TauD/TfdA family dioxygenase n=1 Tax=Bradyrhizobium sp. SZCCHNS1054 TaxID=3057301 RepID=UPI002915D39C|nr:TauD/TfdA family dioxygenase [Bradyrhizobium sp. SZCCHNS1054]